MLLMSLLVLTSSACSDPLALIDSRPEGAMLVWHNWPQPESDTLDDLLDRFRSVHPKVRLVSEYVSDDEFVARFLRQSASGLGPDVIIGVDNVFPMLVEEGLLRELGRYDIETNHLPARVGFAMIEEEEIYGMPFSSATHVLYYNRSTVSVPPRNLDGLVEAVDEGYTVAMPISFYDSYWGVRAFGGEILQPTGEIQADDALTEWLQWLLEAQENPNFLLNSNYEDLRQLFVRGEADFFIGASSELPHFKLEMEDATQVGIARLPFASTDFESGSFLELELMAVSTNSAEPRLAVELINFLTNTPHQRMLALDVAGKIPVNNQLSFDRRLFPVAWTFHVQAQQSQVTPVRLETAKQRLSQVGDEVYFEVLAGVIPPEEANDRLIEAFYAEPE